MKKRWFISLMVLTLALATAGTVSAFALAGGGASEAVIPPGEITHGDPTYDEWILDFGDGKVVTSIDDIDPNVCNLMHNRKPCTPEELEELGNLAARSWIVDPDTVVEGEGEPEPPFVDGEPMYEVQSHEEVVEQDCGLAGGTRGYVNRCVNDIRRRPSQPLIQWRFHPHTVHRDRRLRSTQGPSDA